MVDVQETLTSSNMLASYPVVEFSTAEGRTIRFTSRVSLPIVIEAGQDVPVRYRSDNPERAVIDTVVRTWALPVTLLLAGPTALTIGILTR